MAKTKVEASEYSGKSSIGDQEENISQLARYFIKRQLSEMDLPSEASQLLNAKEVFASLTRSPEFNKTEDIFDQEKFALLSRKLIERLGYGEQLGELDDVESDIDENNQEEVEQEEAGQGSDKKRMIPQKIVTKQMMGNRNKVQVLTLTLKIVRSMNLSRAKIKVKIKLSKIFRAAKLRKHITKYLMQIMIKK